MIEIKIQDFSFYLIKFAVSGRIFIFILQSRQDYRDTIYGFVINRLSICEFDNLYLQFNLNFYTIYFVQKVRNLKN